MSLDVSVPRSMECPVPHPMPVPYPYPERDQQPDQKSINTNQVSSKNIPSEIITAHVPT